MTRNQEWNLVAAHLLEHGLERRGQRNAALLCLAIDFARRAVPQDEAVRELRSWLTAKHNGVSATFNRNPRKALDDVAPIVAMVYGRSRRAGAGTWGSPRPLTEFEVLALI